MRALGSVPAFVSGAAQSSGRGEEPGGSYGLDTALAAYCPRKTVGGWGRGTEGRMVGIWQKERFDLVWKRGSPPLAV